MTKFFKYAFAESGDQGTAIPNTGTNLDAINYQYGFGSRYELELGVDASALPIPRDQSNQLYFQITDNIRQYQTHGVPNWITSADNGGSPYAYDIFAIVRYDAGSGYQNYENQVAANTATPGADDTWRIVSGNAQGILPGTLFDFAGVSVPSGYLGTDGSAVSRTTYAALLSAISFTMTGTTTNGVNTLTGMASTANMYIGMPLEGTGIPAATTVASIVNGTDITMSAVATASGSVSVRFFPWGAGNGTTTFNLPDFRRRVSVGSGGASTASLGNQVSKSGGSESLTLAANDLPAHTHAAPGVANNPPATGMIVDGVAATGAADGPYALANGGSTTYGFANTGNNTTTNDPVSLFQPSLVILKIIKT